MTTITKRATPVAVALMLAWSVSAQAQGFHARTTLVPHLYVGLGTTLYADPLLAGPDYPFGSPRLEGYRPMVEKLHLALGSTYTLHEVIEKRAQGEVSAPVPAPLSKQ
jgi:hypothetical protein